jgi:hypothetical protein
MPAFPIVIFGGSVAVSPVILAGTDRDVTSSRAPWWKWQTGNGGRPARGPGNRLWRGTCCADPR